MKPRIYIDGKEGTTGLQIFDRLGERSDIELLLIDDEKRKDITERKKLINSADIVFLCLPDAAARESVSLIENERTRVIDASTAHRVNSDWVYGLPELSDAHRDSIRAARFVANPGCHATGFNVMVYPLVTMGTLPPDYPLTCFSLTGYSGGGKTMIKSYEREKTPDMYAPRIYALELSHKHLPEMMHVTGITRKPIFCPVIDDYYCGMATTVSIHNSMLGGNITAEEIRRQYEEFYGEQLFVTVTSGLGSGTLESNWGVGTNMLEITVSGSEELTIITARFDNLGKGASGAAVQNMNIMLGLGEGEGLL